MAEACPQTASVEELFDGRLPAEATSDLTAHIATCRSCGEAQRALHDMRSSLRETADTPNAFMLKRVRRELLERAQGGAPVARRRPRLLAITTGFAMLATVIGLVVWLAMPAETLTTSVVVTAASGAQFSRESNGNYEIVRLTDGEFDFDVEERADGRRLLVVVPDGEIEDIGTRFRVVVKGGVTTEVSVSSGEVELRKNGAEPLRLIAGMTYRPLVVDPAASALPSAAATPTAIAAAQPSTVAQVASSGHARGSHPTAVARSSAPPERSAAEPGPTAEDAAYMSVVRLLRAGNQVEARAAAKAYLRDYPNGLRRAEMGAVAAGSD